MVTDTTTKKGLPDETSVKAGYKQTELGVIPENWDVKSIEELTPRGKKYCIVDGPFGSNLKTIHYKKSGIPIITSGYVTNGNFFAEDYIYVDIEKFRQEKRSAVCGGDIVMAKIGERCGASAILPLSHEQGILSGNALKITIDEEKYVTNFIWQILWNYHQKGDFEILKTTGAQPAISMVNLKRFQIPLPKLKAEQNAIATVLSDTDALIENLEKLIAKKKAIKQGAMQQLLTGKKRLPGFSGEWELKNLGEIGETYGGLSGKKKGDFDGGKYPYIPFMNIMSNPVIDLQYFDYVNIRSDEKQNKAIKGDLFFNGSSETPEEVGMCSVLQGDIPNLYLNSFCFGFRLNKDFKTDGLYLSYFFRSPMGRQLIFSLAQGATRYNLSKINFMKLEIPYPDPAEQTAIATILSDMDAEIESLEQKRDKYTMLKQGMMQQLLTGRIRIYANN